MSYVATILNVMIASPGDVTDEPDIVRAVVHEWNVINAEDRAQVLVPTGWDTHSSPEMGDRPQGVIKEQILKNADLLIAVFWTRLGSPTGKAESGTVEEIEEHLAQSKPAMIYFSSVPVRADTVDRQQYDALLAFKQTCSARGLIETYESLAEFRDKLTRHLALTIIRSLSR